MSMTATIIVPRFAESHAIILIPPVSFPRQRTGDWFYYALLLETLTFFSSFVASL